MRVNCRGLAEAQPASGVIKQCRQPRRRPCPDTRAPGTQRPSRGLEGGLAESRPCAEIRTSPHFFISQKNVRLPPPGPCVYFKECRKGNVSLTVFLPLRRVCCDWKSFWPTWLWLCLRSLCCSVKQPSVQINRKGRSVLFSYRKGSKVRPGELESHSCGLCPLWSVVFPRSRSMARRHRRVLGQRWQGAQPQVVCSQRDCRPSFVV